MSSCCWQQEKWLSLSCPEGESGIPFPLFSVLCVAREGNERQMREKAVAGSQVVSVLLVESLRHMDANARMSEREKKGKEWTSLFSFPSHNVWS